MDILCPFFFSFPDISSLWGTLAFFNFKSFMAHIFLFVIKFWLVPLADDIYCHYPSVDHWFTYYTVKQAFGVFLPCRPLYMEENTCEQLKNILFLHFIHLHKKSPLLCFHCCFLMFISIMLTVYSQNFIVFLFVYSYLSSNVFYMGYIILGVTPIFLLGFYKF